MQPPVPDTSEAWELYFAERFVSLYEAVYAADCKLLAPIDREAIIFARYAARNRLEVKPPREKQALGELLKSPPVAVTWPPSSSPAGNVVSFQLKRRSTDR